MTLEQLEYQITLYLDGTLPPDQRPALERRLADDAEARRLLEEHRKLDALLARVPTLPAIHWDKLARHLSQAAAQEDAPVRHYSIARAFNVRRLAVAACLLIAAGAGWLLLRSHEGPIPPGAQVVLNIRGPQPETSPEAPVADITIGPAPALAATGADQFYGPDVVARPSSLVIASGSASAQDSDQPY